MLLLRSIICSFVGLAAASLFAASSSDPIPETDIGRILVDFSSVEPERSWVASAHELNVLNMFKDSERIQSVRKDSPAWASCHDFACRRRLLKGANVDLYIEGTLQGDTLEYRALVPETEQVLSQGSISLAPSTSPEQVKSAFLHAMKPFTESGGILDQRIALRRAEKAAADEGPRQARQAVGIALAVLAIVVLLALLLSLAVFSHGRRPLLMFTGLWIFFALGPLWLISEELALVKPVAIFAIPEPWVLAVIGGLGVGWALWTLGLCILPQIRGLETLKQERMPHVVDALGLVVAYRSVLALLWLGLATAMVLGAQKIFLLDKVHTVALGLIVFGGFATLCALVLEIIAQALDRKYVKGVPDASNPWHRRVAEAIASHPLLAGLDDLSARVLILPSSLDRPVTYGGGLSRPRIMIPEEALEKAFATRPEDNGLAYDFLVGLVLDGLGKVSLRTHLEMTLRLGRGLRSGTIPPSGQGFVLGPYRRSRQLLEACFVAVHNGLGPLMQYLYWRNTPASELLTVSASLQQLQVITRSILNRVQSDLPVQQVYTPAEQIRWLAQNFLHPSEQGPAATGPQSFRIKPRIMIVLSLLTVFIGYQVVAAVAYHPVYEKRLAEQQARIDEKKKKKEGLAHAEEPTSTPTPVPVGDSVLPGGVAAGNVPSVAPAKPKKVVAKTAPRKTKKGKLKKPGKRKKERRKR